MNGYKGMFLMVISLIAIVMSTLCASLLFLMEEGSLGSVDPISLGWIFVVNGIGWIFVTITVYYAEKRR